MYTAWSKHVGSLVMYRAVSQALMMETDPRENEATVNWNMMSAGFISAKDLELIWCLIKKEVRVSISDLLSDGLRRSIFLQL